MSTPPPETVPDAVGELDLESLLQDEAANSRTTATEPVINFFKLTPYAANRHSMASATTLPNGVFSQAGVRH